MADGPWTKYQKAAPAAPWAKYGAPQAAPAATPSSPSEADLITDQAMAAFAAGDDAEGKRLLTEANRAAIAAGAVPEGFVADPRTGGFSDIQNDPSLDMGTIPSLGFGAMQGLGFNFGDEAIGKLEAMTGGDEQFAVERAREMDRRAQENPLAYYGGFVPGAVASALSMGKAVGLGGKALGIGAPASMGGKVVAGGLMGATQGGLAGAGAAEEGGRIGGAKDGALIGVGLGIAAPLVSAAAGKIWSMLRTPSALKAAARGAPSTAELRAAGNAAYKAVDDAGVVVKPDEFARAVGGITDDMRANGMWEGAGKGAIAPKSVALTDALSDVATDPKYAGGVPFSTIDTMRKVAGAPASDVANKLESSLGMRAISGLDDFVNNLRPDQVVSGNADEIGGLIGNARSIWSKMLKSGLIDDAMEKSQNYASGEASGLANRFRTMLNNPKLAKLFTEAEKVAMRRVINGTAGEKALRYLGGGIGQVASMATGASLGGTAGPVGGLLGAGIGAAGSAAARKGSEVLAGRNAELVRALIANGGKASLPAMSGSTKEAIEALIRGGGLSMAPR